MYINKISCALFQLLLWKVLLSCEIYLHVILYTSAATIPSFSAQYPRRLEQSNGYLPPFPATNNNENIKNSHDTLMPTLMEIGATFQAAPMISNYRPQRTKLFSSYVPAPSGFSNSNNGGSSFQYSTPQASQKVTLPSLIPQSVLENFPATKINTNKHNPPQQIYNTQSRELDATTSLVMIDTSKSLNFLTLNQNRTVEAARILASTLLEASGEKPLDKLNGVQVVNPSILQDPTKALNSTDVVIVKSQKNAYFIPMQITKDGTSSVDFDQIYNVRDHLTKAYTVNQFIFIIKPEKINFLNKLI